MHFQSVRLHGTSRTSLQTRRGAVESEVALGETRSDRWIALFDTWRPEGSLTGAGDRGGTSVSLLDQPVPEDSAATKPGSALLASDNGRTGCRARVLPPRVAASAV